MHLTTLHLARPFLNFATLINTKNTKYREQLYLPTKAPGEIFLIHRGMVTSSKSILCLRQILSVAYTHSYLVPGQDRCSVETVKIVRGWSAIPAARIPSH